MFAVYSEHHRLQDGRFKLIDGQLLPPFERPQRAENVLARVREVGLGDVCEPDDGGERAVFSLCLPPGHHAARDLYGGDCFLNNVAVAAGGAGTGASRMLRSSTSTITAATAHR